MEHGSTLDSMESLLRSGLDTLGLDYSAAPQMARYAAFLLERNRLMNLTAITNPEEVVRLHFLDCAALAGLFTFRDRSALDVGSGAGFPGIPLRLLIPSLRLTLLDAQKKRVDFLREVCELCGLPNVNCVHARAEEYAASHKEQFDAVLSRAVAAMPILTELCLPFVRVGGHFLAMKSVHSEEELRDAAPALRILGGEIESIRDYAIPGTDRIHRLILVRKTRPAPTRYPRPYAKIKKHPLAASDK